MRCHGITKDPQAFEQADLALDPASGNVNPWYHEMQSLGYNYRLSDIQAALATSQLAKLDRSVARRRDIAERYRHTLSDLPQLVLPPGDTPTEYHSYHLWAAQFDFVALGRTRAGDGAGAAAVSASRGADPRSTWGAPADPRG